MEHKGSSRIETERLILRRFTLEDVVPMFDNWASDGDVTKYLTWPTHPNVENTHAVVEFWIAQYEKPNNYHWAIALKEDESNPIGSISVVKSDEAIDMVHVGYCIGKPWWHQGIVSEALKALITFFFEEVKVNRVESRFDPRNAHSGDVMKKCGMVYEGTMRMADRNNQGVCDCSNYAILAADYFKNKAESEATFK